MIGNHSRLVQFRTTMELGRFKFWLLCFLVSGAFGEEEDGRCLKKIIAKGFNVKPRLRVHRGPGQTKHISLEYNEDDGQSGFPDFNYEEDSSKNDGSNKKTKVVIDLSDMCKFIGSDGQAYYRRLQRPLGSGSGQQINNFDGFGSSGQFSGQSNLNGGFSTGSFPQSNFAGFSSQNGQTNGFSSLGGQQFGQNGGFSSGSFPQSSFSNQNGGFSTGSFPQSNFDGFSSQNGGQFNGFSSLGGQQFSQNGGFSSGSFPQSNFGGLSSQTGTNFNQNGGFSSLGGQQFSQNGGFSSGSFPQSNFGGSQFNQNGFTNQGFNQNGFANQGFNQNGFANQGFNQNGGFLSNFGNSGNFNFRNPYGGYRGPC